MLQAGQLRNFVTIQAQERARDAGGEWTITWRDVGKAWADIWAKSGQERQLGAANQAYASHTVRMRAFPGLTTRHRILWGARTLGITFIDDTRPGELRLDAQELEGREAV